MNSFLANPRNILSFLVLLTVSIALTACNLDINFFDGDRQERSRFTFAIVDSNYYNLVDTVGKPYHPDSIKIYNQNGQQVDQQWMSKQYRVHTVPDFDSAGTGWVFNFTYLQAREVKNLKKYQETFYLYLNAEDTDTILVDGTDRHGFRVIFNGKEGTEKAPLSIRHARSYFVK